MTRYKIEWNKSNISKSENPDLLRRQKYTESLEDVLSKVEKESRYEQYSDITTLFYLNGLGITRTDPSGNKYTPKINFVPCYFKHSENLNQIVREGINAKPTIKQRHNRLETKLNKNQRLPITAVIECCEATNQDLWNLIEGEKLAGKTSSEYITIPKETPKLQKLVAWIQTEGHIPLSHPSIEINQVNSESVVLESIAKDIEELFETENIVNFSETEHWSGEKGKRLIISSSAVRQFLVLRYNILLGKKSKNIDWNIIVSEDNYTQLLNCFIQTEGSITKSQNQLRFEFKIQDEAIRDACEECLRKIDCSPKSLDLDTYNVGLYSIDDFLKLYQFIENELTGTPIHSKAEEMIQNSRILYQIKNQEWCDYVRKARRRLSNNKPNQEFVKAHNGIFGDIEIIDHVRVSNWALKKNPAPLSAALLSFSILDKKPKEILEEHLQSYISSTSSMDYGTSGLSKSRYENRDRNPSANF